jgi:uncharacterized protein
MLDLIIIHGGDSFTSHESYIKRLNEYEVRNVTVEYKWKNYLFDLVSKTHNASYPKLPCKENAKYTEWKLVFEKLLPQISQNTVLLGHSLGGLFLAKYFSENTLKVKSIHLVAPDFVDGDFVLKKDYAVQLRDNCGRLHLWQSNDDFALQYTQGLKHRNFLTNYTLHEFTDRGHFNQARFKELEQQIISELGLLK